MDEIVLKTAHLHDESKFLELDWKTWGFFSFSLLICQLSEFQVNFLPVCRQILGRLEDEIFQTLSFMEKMGL